MTNNKNVQIKIFALVLLVIQNCALILTMKYSTSKKIDLKDRYLPIVAVTLNECMKFSACLIVVICKGEFRKTIEESFFDSKDYILTCLPAVLYFVQNNLLYFAVSRLDTAVFQVTYQLKILTTAIFSVFLLNKLLTKKQWIALFLLVPGVALVQLSAHHDVDDNSGSESGILNQTPPQLKLMRQFSGLFAVLAACITSGFAGVYFEKVLKGKTGTMWSRNLQLSSASIIIGIFGIFSTHYVEIVERGPFVGFGFSAWMTVMLQALGGLVVAAVVKYADNIIKAFATSVSILLSSVLSYFLFDWHPTMRWSIGACLVFCAVYIYGTANKNVKVGITGDRKKSIGLKKGGICSV